MLSDPYIEIRSGFLPQYSAPEIPDEYWMNQEKDPHGKKPNEPGAKLDAGKQRPGLVLGAFSRALSEVTKIGTFGAAKYSDNGWVSVPNGISRYEDAGFRHKLKRLSGEELDPDSKLLHLAHEAWNILAVLELTLREKENGRSDRTVAAP